MRKILNIAHRGHHHISPENTALAFSLAKTFKFDGIEMDVHLTKDNKLVVIHDETTGRTGNKDLKIYDHTLEELQKIDLGWYFSTPVEKQIIMTFEDFLKENIDRFDYINVEIKTDNFHYPNIEKLMFDAIKPYKSKWNKLIFSSFNFDSLRIMYQLDKTLHLGFLWWTERQFKKVDPIELANTVEFFNPWIEIYYKHRKEYDAFKKPYMFWTINSQKKFDEFASNPLTIALICNNRFLTEEEKKEKSK